MGEHSYQSLGVFSQAHNEDLHTIYGFKVPVACQPNPQPSCQSVSHFLDSSWSLLVSFSSSSNRRSASRYMASFVISPCSAISACPEVRAYASASTWAQRGRIFYNVESLLDGLRRLGTVSQFLQPAVQRCVPERRSLSSPSNSLRGYSDIIMGNR